MGARLLYRELASSDLTTRASSISYTFVFSLIPLVTTTLAFLTAFPGLQSERARFMDVISNQLLPGAVQGVRDYIENFSNKAAAAGAVSSLTFLIVTLMVFQSLEGSFNKIWRIERGRSWGERAKSLAGFLTASAVAAALLVVISQKAADLTKHLTTKGALAEIGLQLTSLLVAWTVFVVANMVLPNTKVRFRHAFVGAAIAGTAWHFLKTGFTWYVNNMAGYGNIYGTLGVIPAFFLWLYLSVALLLAGASIAFISQNLKALVERERHSSRGRARSFYAISVATALARAYRMNEAPVSAEALSIGLELDEYFVNEALDSLCSAELVELTHKKDEQDRFWLRVPAEQLTVQRIINHVTREDLALPETQEASPLHQHLEAIFKEAQSREANVLARVTVADLEKTLPAHNINKAVEQAA